MKVRTDAKRDEILAIAAKAFRELGYERTSMAEISARVGGSKATLYGYFPSKEALFQASTHAFGNAHIGPALSELAAGSGDDDPALVLQRFGEKLLNFLFTAEAIAVHRMVVAEAGQSDVGRLFYDGGEKIGLQTMATFLRAAMDAGRLRRADADVAAMHFAALVKAEALPHWFYREPPKTTSRQVAQMVKRAVEAFIGGYRAS
jgi:AcrR family transcriptional regulator